LLRVGPALLGGPAFLGANVLASAAGSIVSALVSSGDSQGGFSGGDAGYGAGGYGPSLGFNAGLVGPACGAGVSFGSAGWASSGYCGSYQSYPLGWSAGYGYHAAVLGNPAF